VEESGDFLFRATHETGVAFFIFSFPRLFDMKFRQSSGNFMNKLVRILCIVAAGIGVIYLFIDSGNKALNTLVGWIFLPLVFLFGFFCLINYWREDDESEDTEYNEQMKRFRGE
jgi:fatty acid desaturase